MSRRVPTARNLAAAAAAPPQLMKRLPPLPGHGLDPADLATSTTAMVRKLVTATLRGEDNTSQLKNGTIRMTKFPPFKAEPGNPIPANLPMLASWHVNEWAYKKDGSKLPTMARGLFTRQTNGSATDFEPTRDLNDHAEYEIVIRGYDKFFNLGEVPYTALPFLRGNGNALGPCYATVKENGCIIYMSAASPVDVIVASKHSLTSPHAVKGREWLATHLARTGSSEAEWAAFLWTHKVTAVFELADDSFEEHVLAYPAELAGLWLHGLNYNTPEFRSVPVEYMQSVATCFGFHLVGVQTFDTFDAMIEYARANPRLPGHGADEPPRDIEGYVLRYTKPDGTVGMTKYKYKQPYLLFREWRELTKGYLGSSDGTKRPPQHFLSHQYMDWVHTAVQTRPELFAEYQQQRGIIAVRDAFLRETRVDPSAYRGAGRTVIIPVATVGAGKTTVASLLARLFPTDVAHVQNDDITNKRRDDNGVRPFDRQVVAAMATAPIVIADRNNHLKDMRTELVTSIRDAYPDATIVFAVWPVAAAHRDAIYKETLARILGRGENHQTLTPQRTGNERLQAVVYDFTYKRQELSVQEMRDAELVPEGHAKLPDNAEQPLRVLAVNLDILSTPEANLAKLVGALRDHVDVARTWPHVEGSPDSIAAALAEVRDTKVVAVKHRMAPARASYFGVALPEVTLDALLAATGVSISAPSLVPKTSELHVTLLHQNELKKARNIATRMAALSLDAQAASTGVAVASAASDEAGWTAVQGKGKGKKNKKSKRNQAAAAPPEPPAVVAAESATPLDSAWATLKADAAAGLRVTVVVDQYRQSDRVSAFRVAAIEADGWTLPAEVRDGARVLHITAAIAEDAKAVEAGALFTRTSDVEIVDLAVPVRLEGLVSGF
ncbi:RNA ligase-domain-containing protein [Blastocladiella britannica]|nr:RNA ligase-domain-containing protein [Blastocladiella britannica]